MLPAGKRTTHPAEEHRLLTIFLTITTFIKTVFQIIDCLIYNLATLNHLRKLTNKNLMFILHFITHQIQNP